MEILTASDALRGYLGPYMKCSVPAGGCGCSYYGCCGLRPGCLPASRKAPPSPAAVLGSTGSASGLVRQGNPAPQVWGSLYPFQTWQGPVCFPVAGMEREPVDFPTGLLYMVGIIFYIK